MNERIKKLWVDALRSGKYTQSHHALRTVSGFCCLGVLCDIASKESPELGIWIMTQRGTVFQTRDGETRADILPPDIVAWAELNGHNPETYAGSLAYLNDNGTYTYDSGKVVADFNMIADIIEREL